MELWDEGQCYLQVYNVFWDTTGHEENGESFCYTCDSITVLSEELTDGGISDSERRFNSSKWGTVTNKNVKILYSEKVKTYFDPRSLCSSCLFMKNNKFVKDLTRQKDFSNISVDENVMHVNFP